MNDWSERRRDLGWQLDNVNQTIRSEALDMADDAAALAEAVKNEWNISGFDHTRAARGARLDVAIAKRKLLAEQIAAIDYIIKAREAEDAAQ